MTDVDPCPELARIEADIAAARRRGASAEALRILEQRAAVLVETDRASRWQQFLEIRSEIGRLAQVIAMERASRGGNVVPCCSTHTDRMAFGERCIGFARYEYLCPDCFNKARHADAIRLRGDEPGLPAR